MQWTALGISGCCLELAFVATAIWIVWGLKMTLTKKAVVVSLFASRLPCVMSAASGQQLLSSPTKSY